METSAKMPETGWEPIGPAPLEDDLHETMVRIWRRVMGGKGADESARLIDLQVGAGRIYRLLAEIEKETQVALPITVVFQAPTLKDLTEVVRQRTWPPFKPQVLIQPGAGGDPLFIFPGLGGSVFSLLEFARALKHTGPVYVNQQQGLEGGSSPHRTIEEMARFQIDAVKAIQPIGPYYLLGYSLGGAVALETARYLTQRGDRIAFLGLIETGIPEVTWTVGVRAGFVMKRARAHLAAMRKKPTREMLGYLAGHIPPLIGRLGRLMGLQAGGYSPYRAEGLTPELHELREANIEAIYAYRPKKYTDPVSLFRSQDGDPLCADPAKIWRPYATNLTVRTVPGGHETMLRGRNVQVLAKAVSAALSEAH